MGAVGGLNEVLFRCFEESPKKLCFIELPQNFCDLLSEPKIIFSKGKPEALSYFPKNIACLTFYQYKRGILTFQPTQHNQKRSLKYIIRIQTKNNMEIQNKIKHKNNPLISTTKIANYLQQTLPHSNMPYIELGTAVKKF